MKRLAAFLKTTTIGGLFVLLPLVFVALLISKTVGVVSLSAAEIVALLTGQAAEAVNFPILWAVLLVLTVSFLLGLIMLSRIGSRSGRWIEEAVLFRLPGYAALKSIIGGLAHIEEEGMVKPGLVSGPGGVHYFAYVMEEHGDGYLTLFVPSSPSAVSGNVQVVHREKVRMLNIRLGSVVAALNQWGIGTARLLTKDLENIGPGETGDEQRL